jgi:hypothetical protein
MARQSQQGGYVSEVNTTVLAPANRLSELKSTRGAAR